jgi:enoyl-[acyl-carrier protein] reductase II
MRSEICELLGIEFPIFQGGMAWIADASLAGAVSQAGGLGIIAGGNAPKEVVKAEIQKIKKITDKPFGVNIMLLSPFAQDIVDLVCEEQVPVVTTGAGNPSKHMARFKEHNIKVIPVVPSVALGARMEKIGADAVIVEGMEAGGHIGKLTTMSIVPQVVDALTIPVIAAGGIGDGRGMAAVLMLGAEGIQVGTRFLVAKECTVHENYKARILKARDIDTTVTCQHFGHPVRAIKNKLTNEYDRLEKLELKSTEPDLEKFDELGQGALRKAVVEGDVNHGSIMAGQIAGLVTKEQTAKEIIDSYIIEMKETIASKHSQWS